MTSTQVTALVHKWLNCHPYYKHEYGLYSNGLDTFAWQKPHSTLSDPAECMRQYLGLCISNPITSTTFRHHLKNNVKSFIPVLIGKIDGFPSCCYTYRSCTAFSLSWSGWYNNSNYHNIPYTLCADNDDQNILYIRHEVERLQTINNKRDLIVPYNGDHYRVSFRDTPIMLGMDRSLLNKLNFHTSCSSHTPNLYGYLFHKIHLNDPNYDAKMKYAIHGYELIEARRSDWVRVPSFPSITSIDQLQSISNEYIATLPTWDALNAKLMDIQKEVDAWAQNNRNCTAKEKRDQAIQIAASDVYRIGFYDHPLKCMIDTPYLPVLHSLLRGPGDGFSKHLSYYSAIYHDDLSSVVSCLSQVAGLAKLSTKLEKTLKYAPKSKFWRLQINGRQVKQLCDGYLSIVECIDRNIKGKSVRETNWKRYHNVRSLYRVEVIRKQLGVLMTDSLERLSSDIFYTNWIKESKTCLSVLTQCFPEGITPTDYALCVCAPLLLVRFKKYVEHKQLNMSYKQLNEEDMESDNSCWKSLLKAKGNRQDIAIGTIIHWLTFYRIAGIEQFVHPGQDLRYDAANKWTYDRG
eukprot:940626_1